MIGLLVPSDAPVFVGGETAHGVAASPFVYGQSASCYHKALRASIERPSSCQSPRHLGFGPCHQCLNARVHRLNGEHGDVHFLANCVRTGTPEPSPKNLQKSDELGSSRLGTTFLLALQLPRLHESRRGTTGWYDPHGLLVRPLIPSGQSLPT